MEFFYCCRVCAEGKTLEELRAYRPIVTVEGNMTSWDCPECGRNIMISIEGGTIDLGLVRDEQLEEGNDFEVFA
jgi:hypothetical protein